MPDSNEHKNIGKRIIIYGAILIVCKMMDQIKIIVILNHSVSFLHEHFNFFYPFTMTKHKFDKKMKFLE